MATIHKFPNKRKGKKKPRIIFQSEINNSFSEKLKEKEIIEKLDLLSNEIDEKRRKENNKKINKLINFLKRIRLRLKKPKF